ncbi:MAG: HAD hydrolase family protein [Veillonellaceae bacterium]|jgi:3-deoxy-D-manno-octulosonate 8-phosphate phosphatase (KDO 8-P phosphatase)|nr:HAD hydrolase family protein [Veillonellaceae bacterium]
MDIKARAAKIKLLVFDVDGVLTAGQLAIGPNGETMKQFYAQDGLGISAAHQVGIKTAIITGRKTEIVKFRGAELKIGDIYQGSVNKVEAMHELAAKHKLAMDEICYVGDDLNDLAVLLQVGFACAPANAVSEVKERVHYIASHQGGQGAVREIIELILKAQGKWQQVIDAYTKPANIETRQ